ncbi:MAG: 6-bladed beta-propeller, partial [Chloroflexi bacterium]|nr:6-bladed beta-propeller [Chloroflexota bacterium]
NRVQVFSPDGRPLTQWGSKGNGTTQFSGAAGLALDGSGNVYVADQGNGRILKFSGRGEPSTSWRVGGKGTAAGQFNTPVGIAVGPDGSVYVTDFGNNRVQRFTPPL